MIAVVVMTLAALTLQLQALRRLAPRQLVGDEREYLERARATHRFVRAPAFPWLAARCHTGSASRTEARLRLLVALTTVAAVAVTTVAGGKLGGSLVAWVSGTLLLLHPERVLLGCHIWPDSQLSLLIAMMNLALVSPQPHDLLWWLGLGAVCGLGVLTRIDFLLVPLTIPVALAVMGYPLTVKGVSLVLVPAVGLLLLLSVRNARRYGVAMPDDTWAFNLMVSVAVMEHVDRPGSALEPLIATVSKTWSPLSHEERRREGLRALREISRAPWRFGRTVARRLLAIVGPDTFVTQRMLDPPGAYPTMGAGLRRFLMLTLRVATPLLVGIALAGLWVSRAQVAYAIPSVVLLGAAVLFLARTRFRLAVFPTLCLVAAQGVAGAAQVPHLGSLILPLVVLTLVFVLLLRITSGRELPSGASPAEAETEEVTAS